MSCSTNASRSARREGVEHHEQREADRIGQQRLVLRDRSRLLDRDDRLRQPAAGVVLAPRAARAQHVQATRGPTTAVSQAGRFAIASGSERLRRSQDSWTASSASLSEPSMR